MSFLHPLALIGLAAAAIPALLHLLHRRTPPELDFPAVRYLTAAERESARRLKLRHLLLLALRTALVIAIVLAAAHPLVPTRGGGTHQPTAVVVVLDNSLSAGAIVEGRAALERLRRVARASLAGATAADRLWLMLADGLVRSGGRDALLALVDSAAVDPRRLDLGDALGRAARLAHAEPAPAREVHVVSDLQRSALGTGRPEIPTGVRVLALAPAGATPPNRGVAHAEVVEGVVSLAVAGTPGALPAPVTVRWRGRDAGRVLAGPGDAAAVPLPAGPPGWWVGEAELQPDELRGDDRRLFAARIAPPARVAAGPESGPFVAAALAVLHQGRRVDAGAEVTIGGRPGPGATVLLPPEDPALVGQVNRALAARGVRWRFEGGGTPGVVIAEGLAMIEGGGVRRRYRLAGAAESAAVLARVNGEPWLVRDGETVLLGSRLDTAWTSLPATPGFVPFVDALVNRVARGEAPVRLAEGAPRVEFERRGADTVAATVFGPDERESDLTPAPAALAERVLGAAVLSEAELAAARFAGARLADASVWLLLVALLLAAAELAVAILTR
ncbi:MAG: vWA domain-containing protein [Gemmatimonadales bacterium]